MHYNLTRSGRFLLPTPVFLPEVPQYVAAVVADAEHPRRAAVVLVGKELAAPASMVFAAERAEQKPFSLDATQLDATHFSLLGVGLLAGGVVGAAAAMWMGVRSSAPGLWPGVGRGDHYARLDEDV